MKARILSLALLVSLPLLARCASQPAAAPDEAKPDTLTATLLFAGDLMQHDGQIKNALTLGGGSKYDYSDCFALVAPVLERADCAIGNLEVTLGGEPFKGYPCFSAPDAYLDAIQDAGFDILLTANNHCLDRRRAGLERTIDMLDARHIPHCGTYKNQAERDKAYPLLFEVNGIRVVLLNFTYGTNGIPNQAPNIVNYINRQEIAADIKKAKTMQPDVLIAVPHWGIEYVTTENAEQRALAKWLLEQGVDHVIGGHPHVIQPYHVETDAAGRKHVVAYSLGNFISNMTKPQTVGGYMLTLRLQKIANADTTRTELQDVTHEFYFVARPVHTARQCFRVVPESTPDAQLTASERSARAAYFSAARPILSK